MAGIPVQAHVLARQARIMRFLVRRLREGTPEENRIFATWLFRHEGFSRMLAGVRLAARTIPFQRLVEEPEAYIRFEGESSARGVGAHPEESIAGLMGQRFPTASIRNSAQNGMTLRSLIEQLEAESPDPCHLMIIFIGTNDIFQMNPLDQLEDDIDILLDIAHELAPTVILGQGGDVGYAPAFRVYPPISELMSERTQAVQDVFRAAATRHGTHFLELLQWSRSPDYLSVIDDLFHPDDRVHPNGRCYYEVFLRTLPIIEQARIFR